MWAPICDSGFIQFTQQGIDDQELALVIKINTYKTKQNKPYTGLQSLKNIFKYATSHYSCEELCPSQFPDVEIKIPRNSWCVNSKPRCSCRNPREGPAPPHPGHVICTIRVSKQATPPNPLAQPHLPFETWSRGDQTREAGHPALLWWQPQGDLIITGKGGVKTLSRFLKTKLTLIPFDRVFVQIIGKALVEELRNLRFEVAPPIHWGSGQVTPPLFPGVHAHMRACMCVPKSEMTNWFHVVASYKKDSKATGQAPWKRLPWLISNVCHRLKNREWWHVYYLFTIPGLDAQITRCKWKVLCVLQTFFSHLSQLFSRTLLLPSSSSLLSSPLYRCGKPSVMLYLDKAPNMIKESRGEGSEALPLNFNLFILPLEMSSWCSASWQDSSSTWPYRRDHLFPRLHLPPTGCFSLSEKEPQQDTEGKWG